MTDDRIVTEDELLAGLRAARILACPFCDEEGFDLAGLKGHIEHRDCEKYNALTAHERLF